MKRISNNRGFTIGELTAVLLIVFGVIFLLKPFTMRIKAESDRIECANNLRELGKAMYIYAREHQGKFPDTIKTLYEKEYLSDKTVLNCPAAKQKGTPDDPEYTYNPNQSMESPSGNILVSDKEGNHPGKMKNVVYVNGKVSWVKE